MSSNHAFGIATIGKGKAVHLVDREQALCGIKGEIDTTVGTEQDYWTCQRCDKVLAEALRPEAKAHVREEYAQFQADMDLEDQALADALVDEDEDYDDEEFEDEDDQPVDAMEIRREIVRELKLSRAMQRDLAQSYRVAMGSKVRLADDAQLLIVCHDGMTSKGLRQRGLMVEQSSGRKGWATPEGLEVARAMFLTDAN